MNARWIDVVRLRIRSLTRRERVEAELDRELRTHLEALVEENVALGMSATEARRVAARDFGGVEQMKEESRDARGVAVIENLTRDLRYTLRGLLREPLLLVAATASIALGAAGNVAVFSLAKEFVFATPDVRDPADVVTMWVSHSSHASYQRWLDLDATGAIEHIAGYDFGRQVNWFRGDAVVSIAPMLVTANFFDVLGIPLSRGRGFTADEARAERNPRLVVVSHAFWQRELGADSAVLGRSLTLNGGRYTVVGVLAPKLRSTAGLGISPSVYLPFNVTLVPDLASPDGHAIQLIGRLKAGQSLAEARAALDAADRRLARAAGDTLFGGVQEFGRVGTMADSKRRTITAFIGMLAVVSLLVLLIACANVAGLLMARGTARRAEIAIRLAIGGTRARLLQQLMVEAFWLALIGTLAGLGLAGIAMRFVNRMTFPVSLPIELHLAPDPSVLLWALVLVFATMFASALLPALGATRVSLTPALKRDDGPRGRGWPKARGLLLTGQVSVSTVLLVTAFLFLRNLQQSQLANPGFDVDPVVVLKIGFNQGRPGEEQDALLQRMAERARELPGVVTATFAAGVPLTIHGGSSSGRSARFGERAEPRHIEFAQMEIAPGYFAALGIRLLGGRDFRATDRAGAPKAVIVNQEFARRYLDGRALGRRFRFTDENTAIDHEIVGVVANSRYRTIGEELRPAIYRPMSQWPAHRDVGFVLARVTGDASSLIASLRTAIGEIDRAVSVDAEPMRSALAFALLPSRVGASVLGGLGLLGLILAAFGLFAMVSYNVSRRVSEIAIRTALGATRNAIISLVIRDASVLVGVGIVAGLGIAALATRALSAFLVAGLSATDPVSFIGTAGVFLLVTIFASWFPVRYATRVSPAIAMRLE